mmetsp:Transcript_82453/g.163637  ORF Transcript_82453/g.163637 Transcript_82453/m.163637 type:complete len:648 (+) Transcript_82453:72-2015(+)
MRKSFQGSMGGTEDDLVSLQVAIDDSALNCGRNGGLQALALPLEEKAWCMKRDWTDENFQKGAEANRIKLQEFEEKLVAKLKRSYIAVLGHSSGFSDTDCPAAGDVLSRVLDSAITWHADENPNKGRAATSDVLTAVLREPEVLGSALDIVGAYLKNYEVDKAAAVMDTIVPVCRERGELWVLKAMNHLATVRMKQARPQDALACLEEIEAIVSPRLTQVERDEAWEFWETTYRNFGWVMSSLGREAEAIEYIEKAIEVKERVGLHVSWFDLWDLGRMKACVALKSNLPELIEESQAVVARALALHGQSEPEDHVMHAKIWSNLGECSFALAHLAEKCSDADADHNTPAKSPEAQTHYRRAMECFVESHRLFSETEGRLNPLTGGAADAAAWALVKLNEDANAKRYLLNAVEAASCQQNGWGDEDGSEAPALASAVRVVDQVVEVHRRTDDRDGLLPFLAPVEALCDSATKRLGLPGVRQDTILQERLVSSCSLVLVASGSADGALRARQLLQRNLGSQPPQSEHARLCKSVFGALGSGATPAAAIGAAAADNSLRPLVSQLAVASEGGCTKSATAAAAAARRPHRAAWGVARCVLVVAIGTSLMHKRKPQTTGRNVSTSPMLPQLLGTRSAFKTLSPTVVPALLAL